MNLAQCLRTGGVRLLLLACAGVVVQLGWTMVWTLSYRLTHGNDFTYTYLVTQSSVWEKLHDLLVLANTLAPGLEGPDGPVSLDIVVNSLVFAFVVTGVGYLCAIMLVDLGISAGRGALLVVVLFEVVYQVTLFLTPGLFTTDIFSYVMYGHISAIYDLNPYIYPPNYFPANPMLDWIHPIWHDQPSVYGPLWTGIGWIMAHLIAPFEGVVETLPDGNHIRQSSSVKVYRDSEGRTRREQTVNLNGLGSNSNMPQIVFTALDVSSIPNIPWENRGTWGQAVDFGSGGT